MDYLHHHKYKLNSSHSKWTRYMPIISSKIYLGQIQTAVTRNSRNFLLVNTTRSNLHHNLPPKFECSASSYVNIIHISTQFNAWCQLFIDETTMSFKVHHGEKKGWCTNQKVMDYRHMLFVRKYTHIQYLC